MWCISNNAKPALKEVTLPLRSHVIGVFLSIGVRCVPITINIPCDEKCVLNVVEALILNSWCAIAMLKRPCPPPDRMCVVSVLKFIGTDMR
jgi:hypothetical protein